MDLLTMVLTALIGGPLLAGAYQLFKKGVGAVDAMSPLKHRLVVGVLSTLASVLVLVMKQDLPTDVLSWDQGALQSVLMFVVTQLTFLVKKVVSNA